ncbi:MAG TPA: hypothetical protein PKC89_13935 [Pyrinomonadaceae bacterium]|nr:hypothetical protein [Pyrinomonadaceae bacterium]
MKIIILVGFLLAGSASVFSQTSFDIKNASKYFDVKVEVATCDEYSCTGEGKFSFYKKNSQTPYQVIELADTYVQLDEGKPLVNVTRLYDDQSVIDIDDFNFDGMEDVAICNGTNGSYNSPSYDVYLSDRRQKKFVYSPAFTLLGSHLGMFTVNKKTKTLETFDKSGCCWHITERYKVVRDKPVKIFEMVEDATTGVDDRVKITTKTLVRGKWKTSVRYEKMEQ